MKVQDRYKIVLLRLSEGETHEYDFTLDNAFFATVEDSEFKTGQVDAMVDVIRTGSTYKIEIDLQGTIDVPCDRCLEDMPLEVDRQEELCVKLGRAYDEQEDVIVVPQESGEIDLSWFLYEFIALSIPLKHTHAEGECNPTMSEALDRHMARGFDPEMESDLEELAADIDLTDEIEEREIDPRWEKLRQIIDNN